MECFDYFENEFRGFRSQFVRENATQISNFVVSVLAGSLTFAYHDYIGTPEALLAAETAIPVASVALHFHREVREESIRRLIRERLRNFGFFS